MANEIVKKGITEADVVTEADLETAEQVELSKPIVELTAKELCHGLINRFNGFIDLYQAQGNKLGMTYAVIKYKTQLSDLLAKCKDENGQVIENPYYIKGGKGREAGKSKIWAICKVKAEFNGIWENKVANKVAKVGGEDKNFKPEDEKSNGVESYLSSRIVWIHEKYVGYYYLNYIIVKYIGTPTYVDEKGNAVDYKTIEKFRSPSKEKSKQKEADKHGLTLATDVYYRTLLFSNIEYLRIFGIEYHIVNEVTVQANSLA